MENVTGNSYTDQELWQMMREDNSLAFEEIYNRHSDNMFRFALNIFKKKEVCEDIMQNVFIDFWIKRRDVEITNIKAYLFQAVKFQIFKHLRRQSISLDDLTRLNIVDVSMDVSRNLEYEELEDLIKKLVTKLSPRCKEIFEMSRFQNKSNTEIATELGITKQAVKNQISKAIKFIRQEIQPQEVILFFILLHCFTHGQYHN